jgi:hypothetical protein
MSRALTLLTNLRRAPALRGLARSAVHLSRDVVDEVQYGFRRVTRNLPAELAFALEKPTLSELEARIAADLARDGIAIVRFRDLIDDPALLDELARLVASLAPSEQRSVVATSAQKVSWNKEYLARLNSDGVTLPVDHLLLRIGLQEAVLRPINHYLGLRARLHYTDAWYTAPEGPEREGRYSQVWHRDPEDRKLVKVFLYTSDVTETAGPLQYVRGSKRSGGPYSRLWARRTQLYPDLDKFKRQVPASDVVTCTVPAGTMVFCDTAGFHRGGLAIDTPRTLATWMYVTRASFDKRRFRIDWQSQGQANGPNALSALAREALS